MKNWFKRKKRIIFVSNDTGLNKKDFVKAMEILNDKNTVVILCDGDPNKLIREL